MVHVYTKLKTTGVNDQTTIPSNPRNQTKTRDCSYRPINRTVGVATTQRRLIMNRNARSDGTLNYKCVFKHSTNCEGANSQLISSRCQQQKHLADF